MDILSPQQKMKYGNQHVTVSTDPYTKLTRAIEFAPITSMSTVTVLDNSANLFVLLKYLLSDSGLQLVSNLFAAVTAQFPDKSLTTSPYYPHSGSQGQRFSIKIIARSWPYVAEQKMDWEQNVLSLTYA